jgi:hypothetical protein
MRVILIIAASCCLLQACRVESFPKNTQVALSGKYHGLRYYPSVNLDTLNRFDTNNHKIGWWIQLLNINGCPTRNFNEAVFYRYYFKNGYTVYPLDPVEQAENISDTAKSKTTYEMRIIDSNDRPKKDTVIMMEGKYRYYFKDKLVIEEEYKDGMPIISKSFYLNGQIRSCLDFSKKYNNLPLSYLEIDYKKNGDVSDANYIYSKNGKSGSVKYNWIVKVE